MAGGAERHHLRRAAILGGGVMGVGISQVLLAAGVDVAVFDPAALARESFHARLAAATAASEVDDADDADDAGTASVHDSVAAAVAGADLVIEAGPEDVAVKRATFAGLERLVEPGTVLASNTSSIPIADITASMSQAGAVVGMHFWNPPVLVPLVEVVRAERSDPAVVEVAMRFLAAIGMTPVLVNADIPGFVGNRLQHALKREAIALVAAGVCTAETIDTVVTRGFGARLGTVGPLEQSDLVGTELTLAIHRILMPHLDNTAEAHPYLVDMVERGDLGARTGRGFRTWPAGAADRRRAEISADLAAARRRRGQEPPGG